MPFPPAKPRRPSISLEEFDDLIIFELFSAKANNDSEFDKDHRGRFVKLLKKSNIEFYPASSCKRHVYMLRKSDLQNYLDLISKDDEENPDVKFLNEVLGREKYKDLAALRAKAESEEKASEGQARAAKPSTSLSDKINWIKSELEELRRVETFFAAKDLKKESSLIPYLESVFNVANRLSSALQSLKELPEFKNLWSGNITKLSLTKAQKEDNNFFTSVMHCRKSFIDEATPALYSAALLVESNDDIKTEAKQHLTSTLIAEEIEKLGAIAKKKDEEYKAKKAKSPEDPSIAVGSANAVNANNLSGKQTSKKALS